MPSPEQLQIRCGVSLVSPHILLGIENVDYLYINSILLITKYYIYSCKFKNTGKKYKTGKSPTPSGKISIVR
jgi:hypothetical protein